jgi:hypothetical protein
MEVHVPHGARCLFRIKQGSRQIVPGYPILALAPPHACAKLKVGTVSGLDLVLGLLVPRDITAFLQAI